MKRIYLMLSLLLGFLAANATIQLPRDFYENFKSGDSQEYPLDKWLCSGIDGTPSDPQSFFEVGKNWMILTYKNDVNYATSNSSFKMVDGKYPTADEWLISPEFTISEDLAMLQFTAFADGSARNSEYNVYISDAAATPEEFKALEPVYVGKLRNKVETKSVQINDMKGKKVRLAFNNISQNAAYLGFSNIQVAPYLCDVLNNTPTYVVGASEVEVSVNAWISSLVETTGIVAKLVASNGIESTFTSSTDCMNGHTYRFSFPDKLSISAEQPRVSYTITITPQYEGAPSIVIEDFVTRSIVYPRVAVMEEVTGTWCSNCTRGHAALAKYADDYPNNFIGIALHGGDDMQSDYSSAVINAFHITGYPGALVSRDVQGDPTDEFLIKNIAQEPTYASIHVARVDFDPATKKMNVKYEMRNGYDVTGRSYKVAFAIIEDKVTSSSKQKNNYSRITQAQVESGFGPGWWPYMQPYAEGGAEMSMEFEHVGRAIYPRYEGYEVGDNWEANVPVEEEFPFTVSNIANWENTAVVALMMDAETGIVINATKVEANEYNEDRPYDDPTGGISDASAVAEANVMRIGDNLLVSAEAGSVIRVYSASGMLLGSYVCNGGEQVIDGSAFGGVLIVRVDGNTAPAVKKLIWK